MKTINRLFLLLCLFVLSNCEADGRDDLKSLFFDMPTSYQNSFQNPLFLNDINSWSSTGTWQVDESGHCGWFGSSDLNEECFISSSHPFPDYQPTISTLSIDIDVTNNPQLSFLNYVYHTLEVYFNDTLVWSTADRGVQYPYNAEDSIEINTTGLLNIKFVALGTVYINRITIE